MFLNNNRRDVNEQILDGRERLDRRTRSTQGSGASFNDPFADRWDKYQKDGGIKIKLGPEIECLKTDSERLTALSDLRQNCGNSAV